MKKIWKKIKQINKRWPMAKVFLLIIIGAVAGVVIAKSASDLTKWQVSTEAELAKQLEMENEVSGVVGEVTEMPEIEDTLEVSREEQLKGKKLVALTFDDGPSAATTGRLLDILKEKGVKVTFFVLGIMVEKWPEVVQRAIAEGHEVENHTMGHKKFTRMNQGAVEWEIARAREVIEAVTGQGVKYLRTPYGIVTDSSKLMPIVLWSVDPQDWKDKNAQTVRERVVGAVHDGAIVLMHDIYGTTVDAVAGIIDDLRAQGYEMVTVNELFENRGVVTEVGVVYRKAE